MICLICSLSNNFFESNEKEIEDKELSSFGVGLLGVETHFTFLLLPEDVFFAFSGLRISHLFLTKQLSV